LNRSGSHFCAIRRSRSFDKFCSGSRCTSFAGAGRLVLLLVLPTGTGDVGTSAPLSLSCECSLTCHLLLARRLAAPRSVGTYLDLFASVGRRRMNRLNCRMAGPCKLRSEPGPQESGGLVHTRYERDINPRCRQVHIAQNSVRQCHLQLCDFVDSISDSVEVRASSSG